MILDNIYFAIEFAVQSVSKGGYDDFMGDDGAGNYYDDAKDYMW